MRVDAPAFDAAISQIFRWIDAARSGRYVCAANIHMCLEAYDDPGYARVVNGASLVVPDGRSMVFALRLLGCRDAVQLRGADFLSALCGEAAKQGVAVGIYGGTSDSLADFQKYCRKQFPALHIACAIAPPFRPLANDEVASYVAQITESGTQLLFVGLGCPKQEKWMARHCEQLSCVMIGFGAAIDFLSGRIPSAPRWMQKAGLEWLFRLASDPRRLWKRYLKHNPRFVWHFGRQLLREKFLKSSRPNL